MRPLDPVTLQKLKKKLQTQSENANPRMEIALTRARMAVVDSNYWTVETIRTKEGLGDISLAARRLKNYGRPDRIYEIHVDNGIVNTTIREYPDMLRNGWQHQFSLGAGSAVAIAFDGEWELWRKKWRLKTTEKPWIVWVDDLGDLYTQLWDEVSTRIQLASEVINVKAMRGWKNFSIKADDQGIVCAYIKSDGLVYYRNYCLQEDGSTVWEIERLLSSFTGTAENLNLFLTNDFRMGFVIQDDADQVTWHITTRNWSGMAIGPDYLKAGITDITFDVYPVNYVEAESDEYLAAGISDLFFNVAEPIYPMPLAAENPNKSEIEIALSFNYQIDYDLTAVLSAFTITDALGSTFNIISTEPGEDNSILIFNMENFAGESGNMFISYSRNILELDCLNQGSRFAIESFNLEFTPDLAPPEGYATEYLSAGITDIVFNVTKVDYINGYEIEHLSAGITDIAFVVTKVGNNPL